MRLLCLSDNFLRGGLETRVASYLHARGDGMILAERLAPGHRGAQAMRLSAVLPRGFRGVVRALAERIGEIAPDHVECHPVAAHRTGLAAAGLLGLPVTLHYHGPGSLRAAGPEWQERLFRALLEGLRPAVVVVSEETARHFRARYGRDHDLHLVANGVAPLPRLRPAREGTRLAFVSRLAPDKLPGALDLLRLVARDPKIRLDVVGDGRAKAALVSAVRTSGLGRRVRFLGHLDDPARRIAPEATIAGCGRALLEGLAAGRRGLVVSATRVVCPVRRAGMGALAEANYSGRGVRPVTDGAVLAFLRAPHDPSMDVRAMVPTGMTHAMLSCIEATLARAPRPAARDAAANTARAIIDRHCPLRRPPL